MYIYMEKTFWDVTGKWQKSLGEWMQISLNMKKET